MNTEMDVQQEIQRIKKELVELIIVHLRQNKIEPGQAMELATEFLAAITSIKDQKDLLIKLKDLSTNYTEVGQLYVEELEIVSKEQRDEALTRMRDLIKQGKIEEATLAAHSLTPRNSI